MDTDAAADPFSFHPELRDKISDPLTSRSRTLTTGKLAVLSKERGLQQIGGIQTASGKPSASEPSQVAGTPTFGFSDMGL
jgi:hypothetical protein